MSPGEVLSLHLEFSLLLLHSELLCVHDILMGTEASNTNRQQGEHEMALRHDLLRSQIFSMLMELVPAELFLLVRPSRFLLEWPTCAEEATRCCPEERHSWWWWFLVLFIVWNIRGWVSEKCCIYQCFSRNEPLSKTSSELRVLWTLVYKYEVKWKENRKNKSSSDKKIQKPVGGLLKIEERIKRRDNMQKNNAF